MTPELIALGKRAVACPCWRWMPGMLVSPATSWTVDEGDNDPARVVSVRDGCVTVAWGTGAGDAEGGTLLSGDIPDLSDPATVGCLMALVREQFDKAYAEHNYRGTWEVSAVGEVRGFGRSEAEALVDALEAAT